MDLSHRETLQNDGSNLNRGDSASLVHKSNGISSEAVEETYTDAIPSVTNGETTNVIMDNNIDILGNEQVPKASSYDSQSKIRPYFNTEIEHVAHLLTNSDKIGNLIMNREVELEELGSFEVNLWNLCSTAGICHPLVSVHAGEDAIDNNAAWYNCLSSVWMSTVGRAIRAQCEVLDQLVLLSCISRLSLLEYINAIDDVLILSTRSDYLKELVDAAIESYLQLYPDDDKKMIYEQDSQIVEISGTFI